MITACYKGITREYCRDVLPNSQNSNRSIWRIAVHDHSLLIKGLLTYTFVLIPDSENSSRIQCFYISDRLSALCNDTDWCKKVTCLARALVAFASAIPTLPKHCKIPEARQEALLQFVFVPLAVRTYLHIIFFVCKVRLWIVTDHYYKWVLCL